MLLSGGPPVPHPNLHDRQSSPQQTGDYGTILGTPRFHWAGSKQHFPILEERTCAMRVHICSSQCRSLPTESFTLDRCHPAVSAKREGCPYAGGGGPPMLTAHLSGIHLLIPTFPLARPVHDSGQVPHLLGFIRTRIPSTPSTQFPD